jgi:lysozyme
MDRSKLKGELIRDEGIRLCVYQDSVGLWTIGVGHLLGTDRRMLQLNTQEAEALLDGDIEIAYRLAVSYIPDMIFWANDTSENNRNQTRARAIINMAFNLGPRLGGFKKFLAAANTHEWETAAKEMMDSKWAVQVGARAGRLRDMILTED